jgi:50S ribosomal subunit-associated GTPase HflX
MKKADDISSLLDDLVGTGEITNKPDKVNSYNSINSYNNSSNSYNSDINSITVSSLQGEEVEKLAKQIAEELEDPHSVDYYKILASKYPHEKLLEAVDITNKAELKGSLRTSKFHYFRGILNNWGFQTKFKKSP